MADRMTQSYWEHKIDDWNYKRISIEDRAEQIANAVIEAYEAGKLNNK
jgi:hypothetical protein